MKKIIVRVVSGLLLALTGRHGFLLRLSPRNLALSLGGQMRPSPKRMASRQTKRMAMKNTLLAMSGLIFLSTPLAATAQFAYTTNYGTITIIRYTGPGGDVVIPAITNGLPVVAIGDSAFEDIISLTNVAIPGSVTSIGAAAFWDCYNLTSLTIPGSVTSIGYQAFANCFNLTSVTIPASITDFGNGAFSDCTSLTSVTILNGITSIGANAFRDCTSLTSVTIPGSVTSIGYLAFDYCSSLVAINVDAASQGYSSLNGVLFNKSQTMLIEYPGGKAGNYAIPGTVTNVWGSAFADCTGLTSVTIPGSVTSIGGYAFSGCASLVAFTVDAANAFYSSLDGVLFNKNQTTLLQCPGGKAGTYSIPGSPNSIGDEAFSECASLTGVTIPGSVTHIGLSSFAACSGLSRVTIPGSVNNIENYAFSGCSSLTNVTILGGVTNIGEEAFYNCTSLRTVFFKGNAPSNGGYVFEEFDGTNYATIPAIAYYLPGTTGWGAPFGGVPTRLWNPLMQASSVGPGGFGFNITGTADIPIVMEAATNLANASWVPLQSLNLTNGAFYFSDPNWTNYPARFYRIRSP